MIVWKNMQEMQNVSLGFSKHIYFIMFFYKYLQLNSDHIETV